MALNLTHDPYGVNPKKGDVQKTMHEFYQGDTITFKIPAVFADGTKATENTDTMFTLVDKRFHHTPIIWQGRVGNGLTYPIDGVVEVVVPKSISDVLRRGSFLYSLRISTSLDTITHTAEEGSILIEYGADAPNPTLGYRIY